MFSKTGESIEVNIYNRSNNRCVGDPVNHTEQRDCMWKCIKMTHTQWKKDGWGTIGDHFNSAGIYEGENN